MGEVTVRLSFTSHLTRVNRNGRLAQKRSKSILGAKERPSHLHIEVDQGADERVLSKLADWAWVLLTGCVPLATEEIIPGPRGDKYQPPATIVSNPSDQPSPPAVQPLPRSVPGPPPNEKWQKSQNICLFWWAGRDDFFEYAALPWTCTRTTIFASGGGARTVVSGFSQTQGRRSDRLSVTPLAARSVGAVLGLSVSGSWAHT